MHPPLTTPETRRHRSLLISIVLLSGFFVYSIGAIFISAHNISNILQQIVPLALVAIASSLMLSSGYFDLSCGSLAALVGAIAASLHINLSLPPFLAIVIALLVGALAGVWHSYWIVYRQLPSLMVTLASLILFRGLVYGITSGATIGPLQDLFSQLGLGFLPGSVGKNWPVNLSTITLTVVLLLSYVWIENSRRKSRVALGLQVRSQSEHVYQLLFYGSMGSLPLLLSSFHRGLPLSVAVLMVVATGVHCLVEHSRWGCTFQALGENITTAREWGLDVKMTQTMLVILTATICAIAGILLTARHGAATPGAGQMLELEGIAAAVLGGACLKGSRATIIGALLGALILGVLDNGMSLMNLNISYQMVSKGLIILFVAFFDMNRYALIRPSLRIFH